MTEVKSFIEDLEILHTSNVFLPFEKTLKIQINTIKIEIKFINDPKLEEKMAWKIEDDVLKIVFENYASDRGSGILEPWKIGTYKERELYFTFFAIFIDGDIAKCLNCNYAFYSGKEVING